ncbi:type II secretion system F family protein [Novispirillum sp. DQ9]|uniref:type II secretion system F family protein n=1 Tax=Novispirillum sp. DQ9 TaxID=3398612 RepID=UPI003C7C0035
MAEIPAGGPDAVMVLTIAGAVLASLFTLLMAALVAHGGRAERRLRKRKEMFGLTGAGAAKAARNDPVASRQRRIQEKLQELEQSKTRRSRRRNQIKADLLQAGLDVPVGRVLLAAAGCGGVLGLVLVGLGMSPLVAVLLAVVGGFGLPKLVLKVMAARRRKKFTAEFANAVDVLVRGIRSGLPVGECLAIIGRELPDPVGEEFRLLVEGQKLGMALDDLMRRGLERLPTAEYRFFAIVLQIQQQTGGNLAETLEGLSSVLRDRKKMRDKVKALSSEARSSAAIIGSLPFLVSFFVYLLSPDYIGLLFTDRLGNILLACGLLWMALGVAVMAKMINFKM